MHAQDQKLTYCRRPKTIDFHAEDKKKVSFTQVRSERATGCMCNGAGELTFCSVMPSNDNFHGKPDAKACAGKKVSFTAAGEARQPPGDHTLPGTLRNKTPGKELGQLTQIPPSHFRHAKDEKKVSFTVLQPAD